MKTLPYTNNLTQEVISNTPVARVCMYKLGAARTDSRVMNDATALVKAGFAVTIVDVETDRSRPAEEDISGVHFKHIFMPSWSKPSRFKLWFLAKLAILLLRGIVQLSRTETDIYHAHVEKAFPACYVAARLRRKPFILDSPELSLSDPRLSRWHLLSKLAEMILSRLMSRSTAVISISPFQGQEMSQRYHASEVEIIRCIPPYQKINSKYDKIRQYLQLDQAARIALYQGNMQPNRGLHLLIRAARFLEPGIVIVLMGGAIEETRIQLENLIASEGVADRVKIIPPVPYNELLEWTASADIGLTVLPPDYSQSIRWCLPNKFFEYLMAGLPVLTSQLDAIVELIEAYDVGKVVPSLAPEDIAGTINSMLTDPAMLTHMHRNALEVAQREFYWEKESQKLIRLYQRILTNTSKKER